WPSPLLVPPRSIDSLSFYELSPVRATLQRHVDFDVLNNTKTRLSVGTVNVRSGNFLYFDTETHKIGPDHILASGALPPGFPAVQIEGEYYWDGGILSNTPLDWVLDCPDRRDTLVFQVDLWSAKGDLPRNLIEADLRQKEIRFSSRTRLSTDRFCKAQVLRRAMYEILKDLPSDLRQTPFAEKLAAEAGENVY